MIKVSPKILAVNVIDKNGVAQSNVKVVAQSLSDPKQKWILLYDKVDCCFGTSEMPHGLYKVSVKMRGRSEIIFKVRISSKPLIEQVIIGEEDEVMIWFGGRQVAVRADRSSFAVGLSKSPERMSKSTLENLADKKEFEEKVFQGPEAFKIFSKKGRKFKQAVVDEINKLEKKKNVTFVTPVVELPNDQFGIPTKDITIHLAPGVNVEALAMKLDEFDLKKIAVTSHFPNVYQLTYKKEPDLNLVKIVNELGLWDEIEKAELILFTGGPISTQIFPGDVLRPGQYHLDQMGVPEAWQILTDRGLPTYGNADIIVSVDDSGIETTLLGAGISHPDLNTAVVGGNLTVQVPVPVPNSKVYYSFDYRWDPALARQMSTGNDNGEPTNAAGAPSTHGTQVAGTISADQNGARGVVGVAPNTRVIAVISGGRPIVITVPATPLATSNNTQADERMHIFGFDPDWTTGGYPAAQAFPVNFNVPGLETIYNINAILAARSGPGASIVNQSYKWLGITGAISLTYITAGRKGRQRKGMISVGTAANDDRAYRTQTSFGPDNYSLIIAASTVDHLGRETVAGYSSFAIDFSPGIDCCAPSSSIAGFFNPELNKGVITTTRTNVGNINDSVVVNAVLTGATAAGGMIVNAPTAGLPGFINPLGLLRRAGNNNISEWVSIAAIPAVNQYGLLHGTRNSYGPGDILTVFNQVAVPTPANYTTNFGGTSAAAPMVVGVIALMLTANANLTFQDVVQIIRTTCVPINIKHRGPRPANITTAATYNDTGGALISNTDLNWIQFPAGAFGTLAGSRPLMLATDLLDTNGNASVISIGAPTFPPNNNNYPQWFINVGLPGVGPAFQPRQAILIGAETTLLNNVPDPVTAVPQNFIDVVNAGGIAIGNTIRLGRYTETTLEFTAAAAPFIGRTLDVISTDGFQIGDTIDIMLTAGIVSRQITGFGGNGSLMPPPLAGGKTRIILNPAQPTITIAIADHGAIVRTKIVQETNLVYLFGGPPPYVGRNLDVVNVNNFQVGETIDIFLGGGAVQRVIAGFTGATQINLAPAGPTITVNPADAGVVVRSRGITETANVTGIAPVVGGQRLTINNGTPGNFVRHAYTAVNNIPVRLNQTEIRVIKAITTNGAGQRVLETDRLEFQHVGPVRVTPGLIADYSFQFGYGRIDAPAAVRAALNYHLNNHPDVMIRDNMADAGTVATPVATIQSEDIWVRNANDMLANPVAPAAPGPHQMPAPEFQITNYAGTPNHNDIIVTGDYTGGALGTYRVTLDGAGNFSWTLDGGAPTVVPIAAGTAQAMGALGISLIFNTTAYDGTEVWTITAQPQTRFIYVRVTNRGAAPTFTPFALTGGGTPPDFYLVRAFLQLTDGSPVPRFDGSGLDDLEVTGIFGGPGHSKFEIQIDAIGAPDTFRWRLDGGPQTLGVAITGAPQLLSNGVSIRFRATTGHTVNDYWALKARPAAERFKTLDDYVLANPIMRPYSIRSGRAGSRMLPGIDSLGVSFSELEIDQSIDGPAPAAAALAAGANRLYAYPWPETDMPMVRSAFAPRPVNPLRMFLMAEVLPHDGALSGTTVSGNNNLSYRELIIARFNYLDQTGSVDKGFFEVDSFGTVKDEVVIAEFIADVVPMNTESLKLIIEITLMNGAKELRTFEFVSGAWQITGGATAWLTSVSAPFIGTSTQAATADQFHVRMNINLKLSNLHQYLTITPLIFSSIQPSVLLNPRSGKKIPVYQQTLLPSQRFTGGAKADLSPKSHFFTEPANIVQTATEAFGPVSGDAVNRLRATALFKRAGAIEPKAYAVTKGLIAVQRDPANTNCVNIILRPFNQPMLGFTPIKYFIYRGITLTDILKGTSSTDEKLIRDESGSPAFISRIWGDHTNQNGTGIPFEAKALGYDPAVQTATDLLDDLFFRQDPNFQFPSAQLGEVLGSFYTNSGANSFGFEIILEEGGFQPDLAYARKEFHEINVTGLPSVSDADKFAIRMKREEVLNFMDPAAFYGLHSSDKGQITINDGAGNTTVLTPENMFANVINKFYTKNVLYVDIRNENGQSYNFYTKYDNGSGKALKYGLTAATVAEQAYASDGWPLIIIPRIEAANANVFDELFIALRKDYNKSPIVYIEHGRTTTSVTKGRFIADAELGADPSYTSPIGFRFPHAAGTTAGTRIGISWLLKLHYGLQLDAANSPFPNEVSPTETYLDNLFGPLSLNINWKGAFNFAWYSAQDKKFMDADSIGFSQVVNRGIAIQDNTDPNDRVLFYATSKDSFNNTNTSFVPYKSLPGGISKHDSFFDEALLIDGYVLNYDLIQDGTAEIRTLRLEPATINPRPVEGMLALGLTKIQYDALRAVPGFSTSYPRNVQLDPEVGSPFTVNGNVYYKYRVGVKGMDVNGDRWTFFPGTDIFVYSIDQLFFFSAEFSALQVLPTLYTRNYEEALGLAIRSNARYPISGMEIGTNSVQILGKDLRYEIVPGDKITIKGSASHDGTHDVTGVSWNGTISQITIAYDLTDNTHALGDMHETDKAFEDFFIDKDIIGDINSTKRMRTIINDFVAALTAAPDTVAGLTALTSAVNTFSLQAWNRVRELCFADTHAYADDRILYWARIKMLVALKGHPQVLKSIKERNRLVKLFEDGSRGISSINIPATGIKVVIAAFDPYYLGKNILRNNPGAAAALAMDGRNLTVTVNGNPITFHVEAVVLPVKYEEFDRNGGTGIVEDVLEKYINPTAAGFKAVDLLLSLGVSEGRRFELSRYAARKRGGVIDNASRPSPPSNPAFIFPESVPGVEYYQTKLPVNKMVPATNPSSNGFDVIFDNSFKYTFTDAGNALQTSEFPDSANAAGTFQAEDAGHSNHTSLAGIVPSDLSSSTTPRFADIASVEGSAGNYFSNEIMYRTMRLAAWYNGTLSAGHLCVPNVQPYMGDIVPADNANVITAIMDEIAKALAP